MNHVIISGNLTRDPELTHSGDVAICKFGMAVNQNVKRGDEWAEKAHFVDVTYFGRRGELMAEKANKGDKVHVTGRVDFSAWETDAGEKRSKLGVVANDVEGEFVYRKSGEAKPAELPTTDGAPAPGGDDDDIPF